MTRDYLKKKSGGLTQAMGEDEDEDAAREVDVDGHVHKVRTKTFKILDEPTIEELTIEIEMLRRWMPLLVKLDSGFDSDLNDLDDMDTIKEIEDKLAELGEKLDGPR